MTKYPEDTRYSNSFLKERNGHRSSFDV